MNVQAGFITTMICNDQVVCSPGWAGVVLLQRQCHLYTLSHREWEKKGHLSDFKQGNAVVTRWTGLYISEPGFSWNHLYSSLKIGLKRENIQQFSILLISEVKGEWADCFKLIARQQ